MGPDCGTAILDGVPLGFANAVRRGTIGLIAASGTGLQQVSCLIDRYGAGVSQAIGVGGRDLDERVGGAMMLAGLERLAADPGTHVIVLISKPPAASVAERVLAAAGRVGKPVVVNFLGGDPDAVTAGRGAIPRRDVRGGGPPRVRAGWRSSRGRRRRWGRRRQRATRGPTSDCACHRAMATAGPGAVADPRPVQRRLAGGRGQAHPALRARPRAGDDPRDPRPGRRRVHRGPAPPDDRPAAPERAARRRRPATPRRR